MMQKRLAGQLLKCPEGRIRLEPERISDIREAITKEDIRTLISEGAIRKVPEKGSSKSRARKKADQRRKGRRKGQGSKKGKRTARLPGKKSWIGRIRLQREFLQSMKTRGLISNQTFTMLYRKSKGGFFRNKRHLKLYVNEQKLITK
ncbi:50S ribosomal protein L19e [Candidatus Woesearchaeota archaeon]|nr:50S ribosomal protein L19e [Candidatus Woesearchaeota archaeon]